MKVADGKVEVKATFTRPGTYTLRAFASDGLLRTPADVTVTVGRRAARRPFLCWPTLARGGSVLHKTSELRGYHIHATDGEIGHVDDFLIDDGGRAVQYLVVDTSNWIGGRSVLISTAAIARIDSPAKTDSRHAHARRDQGRPVRRRRADRSRRNGAGAVDHVGPMPDTRALSAPILVADQAGLDRLAGELRAASGRRRRHRIQQPARLPRARLPDPVLDPRRRLHRRSARDCRSQRARRRCSPTRRSRRSSTPPSTTSLCLRRDYGFEFANIFDTMSAARTLGWPQVGLAAILDTQFGVTMNKKYQRADWKRRPLTPEQLDYARLDTHYLLALRDQQLEALTESGRWQEAQEEFERLARLRAEPTAAAPDPAAFWRVKGARELDAGAGRGAAGAVRVSRAAGRAHRPPAVQGDGRGDADGTGAPRAAAGRGSAGRARPDAGSDPPPRARRAAGGDAGARAPRRSARRLSRASRTRCRIATIGCTPGARSARRRAASSRT